MSPASRSASARSKTSRARPSTVPGAAGRATSASAARGRQAHERLARQVAAAVTSHQALAVRGQHARRRQRGVRPKRLLALVDQLVVHLVRARQLVELLEGEVEDVLLVTEHAGIHEALGLSHPRLLIDEVADDHAVLRILAVAHERPHEVDPAPHLAGLLLAVRQRPQALQQLPLLLAGVRGALREPALARTGLKAPD